MTYRGYTLSLTTRRLAGGATEGVEIRGERVTWAGNAGITKRAIDAWEKAKEKAGGK